METKIISMPSSQPELAPGINYFFAVLPADSVRAAIAGVGERFQKSHRLNGAMVDSGNLHLLLCPMGKPDRLRQPVEAALLAAAGEVHANGFVATLESAMRFSARDGHYPFVLCTDNATTDAFIELRKTIAEAQRRFGLQVSGVSSFLPHVTLLQGVSIDTVEEAIMPIQWQVDEFVLIRSFFGQCQYEVIGRWPLNVAAAPEPMDMLQELADMENLPDFLDLTFDEYE